MATVLSDLICFKLQTASGIGALVPCSASESPVIQSKQGQDDKQRPLKKQTRPDHSVSWCQSGKSVCLSFPSTKRYTKRKLQESAPGLLSSPAVDPCMCAREGLQRRPKLYTLQSILYTPHFLQFTLYTPHCTLYALHFTIYTLHSTHYTPQSTHHTPHSTLHTPHSTLNT